MSLVHLLLVSAYLLPMLIGHGGMHALLGVEHHCCAPTVQLGRSQLRLTHAYREELAD